MFISKYERQSDGSFEWTGDSHSMMINEMWIHRKVPTFGGHPVVTQINVSLLEGNSGSPGRVKDTSVFEDLLSVTPRGDDFIGSSGKKIKGFGVDLDASGHPIYDTSKLHYINEKVPSDPDLERIVETEAVRRTLASLPVERDPLWETYYEPLIPKLVDYAKYVRSKGISVTTSSNSMQVPKLPNGGDIQWIFPPSLDESDPQGFSITIDLLQTHPLPVLGLVLSWDGRYIPLQYSVQWAGEDKKFTGGQMQDIKIKSTNKNALSFPVYISFSDSGQSAKKAPKIRYIKLSFPKGTFAEETALRDIRFIYEWGPTDDAKYNP